MSAIFPESTRHIFPRWRSFEATANLGELTRPSQTVRADTTSLDLSLASGIAEWKADPSLWKSLDLLGTVMIAGRIEDFDKLLREIQDNPRAPKPAKDFVARLSLSESDEVTLPNSSDELDQVGKDIHVHRKQLLASPLDPVEWIELARSYTIAGSNEKARRAVLAALQLAPNNRFVLRSAARFFIHIGESDRADALLSRSPTIKLDPWILASQIAISDSLGKASKFFKFGRTTLDSDLPASEITELAAALGSQEAESGNHRFARKLLRRSLERANENSVAQIRWLNRSVLQDPIDESNVHPPLLHEANAKTSFYKKDFEQAGKEALKWLEDQPFSSAPAAMGSYILADIFLDFEYGKRIAERGLVSNQDDANLLNNLAVCLMELGELERAENIVNRLKAVERGSALETIFQATHGMLAFRKGEIEIGRKSYLEAVQAAKSTGDRPLAARAMFHLAIEEILAHTDQAEIAMQRIVNLEKNEDFVESAPLLKRVLDLAKGPVKRP